MTSNYVIGLDYGTDSVRSVLVQTSDGKVVSSTVHWYSRWAEGKYCNASVSQFRQHLRDHLEGAENTIKGVIEEMGVDPLLVKGICIDTTGSSPLPVDDKGIPLCLKPEFEDNPNAMVVLWKDHTAIAEADEINQLARNWGGQDFTCYEGGIYSSEWFWAKILHIVRKDHEVKAAAHSWMEHCDIMPYILTGSENLSSFKRSRCAAGHKAMWHQSWNGLPEDEFLRQLDSYLVELKGNLYSETYTADTVAGHLSDHWATKLGLSTDTVVTVGTFDAHAGAVGAEVEENTLVRVMGTSTCDIIVASPEAIGEETVKGICGQVDGSVIPGLIGLEAGQSAFGDALAWFKDVLSWSINNIPEDVLSAELKQKASDNIIRDLSAEAATVPVSESVPIALDWINGRRTPDANQALKAAITNLTLGTKAPEIFRALVESICFGSRRIVERFISEGVGIKTVVGIGGVAKKSPFIMQTLANVLNMPIKVAVSDQAPALGAAMYAATAAGVYRDVNQAIKYMGQGFEQTFNPDPEMAELYSKLYKNYLELGNFIESHTQTH